MSWEQRVLDEIERTADDLIELAGDLIRIPSENPPGDCTEVSEFIAAVLRKAGVDVDVHDAGQGRISIVSHQGPAGDRHLVLAGHSDVVPVGDVSRWSFPPFAGDVVDGYLRGRGASDMKAGLAGVMHAYVVMHRLGVPLNGRLSLAAVPDEEAGGPLGADWLLDQGVLDGATGAVIAEPAERTHPTIGQKGSNWFRLTVSGRPGHGSLQPLHGTNANLQAAKAIVALQGLWELVPDAPADVRELIALSQRFAEEREGYAPGIGAVFDHVTINVGKITGGSATNVVADKCVVEIDTRVPIGLSRAQVLARVDELLAAAGVEATVEPLGFRSEPNWTLPDDPIVVELVSALRELTGEPAEGVLQWASSDARTFRSHGIPVLQYGPAELATIHGFDERAPVADVVLAAKTYALTTLRYLGVRDE
ncbi:M20 family metallopeptidase [Kribbella solani]|uniref:Probable succinyl-diaminopimelate desuccinylase n=1 Tax=Kribbella solani TaxID=236067 RepID=A0A841DJU4_9ACTN|nr:M20 family metallopeptidase [Kribbella solani]MBB5976747.1 succinyl-diaminopimelate desuccinylase [Kribbella solani]